MGIMGFRSSCNCVETVERVREVRVEVPRTVVKEVPYGNPNPKNFKVQIAQQVKNHLVVEIFYPDCKNYEGRKILVYRNMNLQRLMSHDFIDPHFCNKVGCLSPIARFEPTEFGWELALRCCEDISIKEGQEARSKMIKNYKK